MCCYFMSFIKANEFMKKYGFWIGLFLMLIVAYLFFRS